MKALLVLPTLLLFSLASSSNIVKTLPGFDGLLPFHLETGYIGVGEGDDVRLFYYFIKSDRNPKEDPLIAWISGGLTSAFRYQIIQRGVPTLVSHPYSWTKWLEENPIFKTNPLYIGGDSYSGKIVPVVTHELIKDIEDGREKHLNLKGYIAGNPLISEEDINTIYPYAHRMGFIPDEIYKSYGFMLSYYWANNETVREALHIKKGTIKEWISGDHDMRIPHLGTQAAIKSLNFPVIDHWRPFTFDGQVAGPTTSDAGNIAVYYATTWRPTATRESSPGW
ncbi:Serine carboxypeptidase-like 7 [Acorus calamus]|uniref:Serine carboxypeptidase-like 7 n=1 Tax=Acorus calamus TaxID=4465 RepID=A0AAV9CLJ7_ACOCL|nr:Serine carboxypeptidase-like 7 [Acorus calamus]